MKILYRPSLKEWEELCIRPSSDNPEVKERVRKIIARVKTDGDKALRELSEEIDGRVLKEIRVVPSAKVSDEIKVAIKSAAANIEKFHRAQLPQTLEVETAPGVKCIQKPVPIEKVGLYIPGGTAPLFSTVLMLALPAKIAGCKEISLCTPSGPSGKIAPEVLYAAEFCGVKNIYGIGGAQAIAAMAYGTETVKPVYKIFGPGNQYVTCAKQMLAGSVVAVDMPAGPSEVMIIADSSANAQFVAADLLSQAEHGSDSQVMLVTDNKEFAQRVSECLDIQLQSLPRKKMAGNSLTASRCIILESREQMVEFANLYAPEHLIVSTIDPWNIVDRITAAGSVFVGAYSPESAGDYASGTNHTLPTCGWAKSFSGVNIDSFIRKMTIQEISQSGLKNIAETITTMAEAEGLHAHAQAVRIRMK